VPKLAWCFAGAQVYSSVGCLKVIEEIHLRDHCWENGCLEHFGSSYEFDFSRLKSKVIGMKDALSDS